MALVTKLARREKAVTENTFQVYRYSTLIRWLVPVGFLIMVPLFTWAYFNDLKRQPPVTYSIELIVGMIVGVAIFILLGLRFERTRIILTDTSLIKRGLFGSKEKTKKTKVG
ncbi:hypothetical protein JYT31_02315 [Beggiatoa alba]|nr:hypothetical protein [Beggiatoa alba]